MHALLERDAEPLTRKLIEKALAGDAACLRLCFERLYPPYKAAPEEMTEQEPKTRVINLKIFDDTGTAVDLKESRASPEEA